MSNSTALQNTNHPAHTHNETTRLEIPNRTPYSSRNSELHYKMKIRTTKERVSRASLQQKEMMLQFMEQHPEIGNEKIASQFDIYYRKQKWSEMTKILNRLPGRSKTPLKWQKAWQDWRYNTRKKFQRKLAKNRLSNMEQRLLNVSNIDSLPLPPLQYIGNGTPPEVSNWIEESQIKQEEEIESENENESEGIGDLLETNLIELSADSNIERIHIANISTLSPDKAASQSKQQRRIRKRRHVFQTCHVPEMKCLARKFGRVAHRMCAVLEDNSKMLERLVETQMRQAEALERQVSLEESRNSILKMIVTTLATIKKIS